MTAIQIFFRIARFLCAATLVPTVVLLLVMPAARVSAHGSTQVGDYILKIGLLHEPALQDEPNGLELIVTNSKTNQPVEGLENSLQAEIIFGASRKTLKIEPAEDQPGSYTAPVLPTAVGDYTWRIFGKIENTPVDVSMTSAPDTFASVVPKSDDSFPGRSPSLITIQAELQRARLTAIIGIVTGVVGILLGIIAMVLATARSRAR